MYEIELFYFVSFDYYFIFTYAHGVDLNSFNFAPMKKLPHDSTKQSSILFISILALSLLNHAFLQKSNELYLPN